MNNFDLRKFLTENKLTSNSKSLNESIDEDSHSDYKPGTIAPKDLYHSDKHGKLVGLDDVDDKYHDSLKDYLVVKKGDKVPSPMDEENGKSLTEAMTVVGNTPEETEKNAEEIVALANKLGIKATIERRADGSIYGVDVEGRGHKQLDALQKRQLDAFQQKEPVTVKPGQKLKKLTVGGKTYELGDFDPNDDGRIESIEKYSNGYAITGGVYADYGDGDDPKEMYSYAIDLKGNEMDEEDLQGRD